MEIYHINQFDTLLIQITNHTWKNTKEGEDEKYVVYVEGHWDIPLK